jgi:hypothetical protein
MDSGGKEVSKTAPKWGTYATFPPLERPQWENLNNALQSPERQQEAVMAGGNSLLSNHRARWRCSGRYFAAPYFTLGATCHDAG